ncbi:hypothetical protein RIF29_17899 [Crotalaria pallida]|uniref:VQ domain-containing protein n=1 Tax=Crotalaria pallida TaxID=3830 RepID=A0AAN9FRQ0_CROPI
MSKKLNQASLKISKKNNEKQEFNSLIKVLRPKVYITDSSSFKKLVQELTGNTTTKTTTTLTTTSTPTPPLEPKMVESFTTLIEPDDDDEVLIMDHHPETSVEVSLSNETTTTTTSSSHHESCYNNALMMMDNEFNQVCNQICLEDIFLQDSSVANQPLLDHNLWAYQNLESLLFDDDDDDDELNPFFNCYEQIIEPAEVSIYDYELSGLLL